MENSNENSLNLPWSEIFSFMKLGLTSLEIISPGAKTINVKDLKLINDNSIECHFYTKYNNSIDIKTEVSTIVGFLYGFTKNTIYNGIKIKYFSTKAYDTFDTEVMYSISHLNSAKLISDGDSMDWLKSTLFQENTSEYRLGLAKKMIYEIENSLRLMVEKVLNAKHGINWWSQMVGENLRKEVERTYSNQFNEETTDGGVLLKFTHFSHLKKIICTRWIDFKSIFPNKIEFEKKMDSLNVIRREEAHNRSITKKHISDITVIYNYFLSLIAPLYPDFIPEFLIENWRLKIKEIMVLEQLTPLYSEGEVMNEPNLVVKLLKTINTFKNTISNIKIIEERLNTVIVPVQKAYLHNELLINLREFRSIQEEYLEETRHLRIDVIRNIHNRMEVQRKKMNAFVTKFLLSES